MQGSEERLLLHRGLWPVILARFSTSVFWFKSQRVYLLFLWYFTCLLGLQSVQ
jgi:hypothetical protein